MNLFKSRKIALQQIKKSKLIPNSVDIVFIIKNSDLYVSLMDKNKLFMNFI